MTVFEEKQQFQLFGYILYFYFAADLRKLRQPMAVEPLDLDYEEISPILKALSENDGTREIQQNLTDVKNTDSKIICCVQKSQICFL